MQENHYLKVKDIIKVTNGTLLQGNEEEVCEDFSRDTRNIKKGEMYLGIKGESINGGIYWKEALDKGAKGVIVQDTEISEEERKAYPEKIIIQVKDVVEAMGKMAKYKRSLYHIPFIAITGSVGKTSTKDMVASVMDRKYNTLKTQGNYNNQIGLPLTILSLKEQQAAVVEMGMNHFGEISYLTNIAKPDVAVITNIGTAHIGILGSRENILKAKMEILEGLSPNGTVVINKDNDLLQDWYEKNKNRYNIITYGIEQESDYMAKEIESYEDRSEYVLYKKGQKVGKIIVPVGGNHFIQNSLCAIAVGETFEIPMEKIQEGIQSFELTKKRMDITKKENGTTIINDCYNANLDSMRAAIEYLGKIKDKRKIAVLGDMLELGDYAKELHRKVGDIVAKENIDSLITVGTEAKEIAREAQKQGMSAENIKMCESNEEAAGYLKRIQKENDVILFKASNAMHFDEIIHNL